MMQAIDDTSQVRTAGDDPDVETVTARLAELVRAACGGAARGGVVSLPSERELSVRLGVSRHAVRNALSRLQQQGLLSRAGSRGSWLILRSLPPAHALSATDLRCINFVFGEAAQDPAMHWQREDYLAGYTEVLENQVCKTRHLIWSPQRRHYDSLVWPHAHPSQQASLLVGRREPELLSWLLKRVKTLVVQNYCLYDYHCLPPHHKVYVNKSKAAFDATQHLMKLGHRRIGFVGSTPAPSRSSPEHDGYLAAVSCAGFQPNPADIVHLNTESVEEALAPCRRLLKRPERPTAVFGGSGAVAVAFMEAAKSLGLRVPQDLSIIGFDDNKTAAFPQLSTIAVPRRGLARQALELLLEAAHQPSLPPQTRVVECQINYRETTGPAPDEKG